MSRNKYECMFCFEHYDNWREAEEHEDKCSFNPALKTCWSCKFRRWNSYAKYGDGVYCGAGLTDKDRQIKEKDNLSCTFYQPSERAGNKVDVISSTRYIKWRVALLWTVEQIIMEHGGEDVSSTDLLWTATEIVRQYNATRQKIVHCYVYGIRASTLAVECIVSYTQHSQTMRLADTAKDAIYVDDELSMSLIRGRRQVEEMSIDRLKKEVSKKSDL